VEFTPPADLRVTNVALSADLADETGRTTVKLIYIAQTSEESDEEDEDEKGGKEDKEQDIELIYTVLCSLRPGTVSEFNIRARTRLLNMVID
jgi:FK506-binding nuclear protein